MGRKRKYFTIIEQHDAQKRWQMEHYERNKEKLRKIARERYKKKLERKHKERSDTRKTMVSTGDRSAKIRTYNYPQGRITDHRINLTLYKLEEILNGDLTEIIDNLKGEDQKIQLEENI